MSFLSSPKDKERLVNGINELCDSFTRVDAEKDLQKDIVNAVHEDTGIDKKLIRKLAAARHKRNFPEVVGESEDFQALYEECF